MKGAQMKNDETFEIFWRCFPRRIAKASARKAFDKAIKLASLEQLLDAITVYVANKPAWQDYKHPATWLNSHGWLDEYEVQQPRVTDTMPNETSEQRTRRFNLMNQYRFARDEGDMETADRIRRELSSCSTNRN